METSPLLRLPAEIRNHIFELALYQDSGLHVFAKDGHVVPHSYALALCCRRLYDECMRLFYNTNHFFIYTRPGKFGQSVQTFVNSIKRDYTDAMGTMFIISGMNFAGVKPTTSNHRAIRNHLMTVYLNIRDNAILREHIAAGKKIHVGIAYFIRNHIFKRTRPYIFLLSPGDLKASLEKAEAMAKGHLDELLCDDSSSAEEKAVPIHVLRKIVWMLGELAATAS